MKKKQKKPKGRAYQNKDVYKAVCDCIRIIEDVLGGYDAAQHVVQPIEQEFGLKDNPRFTEAKMVGRI